MFKKILIGLVLVVGGFLAYAATRPDTYHVERSLKIDAPSPVVYAQIEDFRNWEAWSPWEKLDPDMKKTFDGPEKGVGATYRWEGNADVGKGKMTITDANAPTALICRLEFMEPFQAVADTGFALSPQGESAVEVTWSMDGTNNFLSKVFGVFMDMEKAIGKDYEKGLTALKAVSEEAAQKQVAMANAAAEAAATEEAAKAAAEAELTQEKATAATAKNTRKSRKSSR